MSQPSSRRGFFARLFGGAAGAAAVAGSAAPAAAPARCAHYHDGAVWRDPRGPADRYVRHDGGCPFCSGALPAASPEAVHIDLGRAIAYTYDAQGNVLSATPSDPSRTYAHVRRVS